MKRYTYHLLLLAIVLSSISAKIQMVSTSPLPKNSPKRYDHFQEFPINSVIAQGWLKEFLNRQRNGLTGHPEVLSYPFNTCLWGGVIQRVGENRGDNWWRYEQTAYYTDGLLRLGYLLKDSTLINKGKDGVYYTISHPQKNGRLGPDLFPSQWPIAVFFRAMQAEYEATKNAQILDALHQHYLSYTPKELGEFKRAIVNIEGALWVYGKTGDNKLIELAEKAYALGGFELNLTKCLADTNAATHGVTYMEMAKLPAILYSYTGKKIYLDAAVNAMKKLDRDNMLPDGVPTSNEFIGNKNPLNSHETCDISDYTWAVGYLLMATGDAVWADHIEKAIFNAGPGAVSKDFRNLQYFSSPNQVIATGNSNQNAYKRGLTWMAYWPCHETECCAGNVHRFMPNYVARMWLSNNSGGPVAALYGPSIKNLTFPDNKRVTIHEKTTYPFSEKVTFTFDMAQPVKMPFTFRIPAWCNTASVFINGQRYKGKLKPGTFVTLNRRFSNSDEIILELPMSIRLEKDDRWGTSIQRGPLLFAYAVPEKVTIDNAVYPDLDGKRSPDASFPALDIRPAGVWNLALNLNSSSRLSQVKVLLHKTASYPFDPGKSPITIQVPAMQIKGVKLEEDRFTPILPGQVDSNELSRPRMIDLVPYGSTRLRLSVFPIRSKK